MGATSLANVTWRAPALTGACAEIACVSMAAAASTKAVTEPLLKRLIGLPSSNTLRQMWLHIPASHAQSIPTRNPIPDKRNAKLKLFGPSELSPHLEANEAPGQDGRGVAQRRPERRHLRQDGVPVHRVEDVDLRGQDHRSPRTDRLRDAEVELRHSRHPGGAGRIQQHVHLRL